MEQTRALNALEPFLALSKSANSPRAAADLVSQATSAQNTYVFAELLQTPNIQALRQIAEYAKYLTLLEIFAWGTWADYKGRQQPHPQSTSSTLPKHAAQSYFKRETR
jgi:COP9 signalosome complex subunit 7